MLKYRIAWKQRNGSWRVDRGLRMVTEEMATSRVARLNAEYPEMEFKVVKDGAQVDA